MPDEPWIMTQSWHDLLFAHWPVDGAALTRLLPPALALDRYDRQAWVGVVPFRMTNVAPRGVPALPLVSAFNELNVRTYVTVDGKPGVYFFSLDADNALAVAAAKTLFGLPYFQAAMRVEASPGEVRYRSHREGSASGVAATFAGRYRPVGSVIEPRLGTLEHFLTERYCLYTVDEEGRPRRLEIHHAPWLLQEAEAVIETNTMAEAAAIRLAAVAPLLHFARRQDMVAFAPHTVRS